jgi:predicted ATPase/DNA-binding winged helix-turn-helix (wHTH) protein
MPGGSLRPVFASGECEIDLARRELRVLGAPVPIGSRAFEIVQILAQSAGELVTKDELMARVWPGAIVNDNALQVHISAVRKALGAHRAVLKTESGRGYRLLGTWSVREQGPATVAPHTMAAPPQLRVFEKTRTTNIPAAATGLIGRLTAIQRLRDLVSAYRVVTLTGPGGIGKTALALEVARRLLGEFADAAWLVELASLSDPDLVPTAVAGVLGLRLGGEEISAEAVAQAVGEANLLLILDNCEHVIDAAANFVEAIVRMCPRTTILATSRETLRTDGEHVYRVPPLEVPAVDEEDPDHILDHSAVELFIARTKALGSDFSLQAETLPSVAAICRHLDGIPLAIEFAAARAATFGVQQVAVGLRDRFALLISGRRTALPRHRTLRATLDWSHELLPEAERLLLRRLAIFPAGFTLDAAAAVTADAGFDTAAVTDGVVNLVTKSLVMQDKSEISSRWYLPETIRAYALEKLTEDGEADTAARHHATYFRDFSVSIATDFGSRVPSVNLAAYACEIDNVRGALDWCFSSSGDVSIGTDLATAYAPLWSNLGLVSECRRQCERALHHLDATQQSNARLRMRLQIVRGSALLHTLGPSQEAETVVTEALAAADALGDQDAQARALSVLTGVYAYRGEYARSLTAAERISQIASQIGDRHVVAAADGRMGIRLMTSGRLSEARRALDHAIQSFLSQEGDRRPLWREPIDHALARATLARVLWLQGFAEAAHHEAQLSCDAAKGVPDQLITCRVLYYGIGRIAPMIGDFTAAADAIAQLTEVATNLNASFWVTAGRFLRGKLLVECGKFAEGLLQLSEAFGQCEETGWRLSYPEFMGSLALALAGLGRLDEAHDAVSRAIAGAGGREDGQVWYVPELLRIKAEILLQQSADQSGLAEDCLEQAATMAREQGALTWELRVAVSHARLRVSQHRRDEAREILGPVYDKFTEGFETTDMRAARSMLDTLSS